MEGRAVTPLTAWARSGVHSLPKMLMEKSNSKRRLVSEVRQAESVNSRRRPQVRENRAFNSQVSFLNSQRSSLNVLRSGQRPDLRRTSWRGFRMAREARFSEVGQ